MLTLVKTNNMDLRNLYRKEWNVLEKGAHIRPEDFQIVMNRFIEHDKDIATIMHGVHPSSDGFDGVIGNAHFFTLYTRVVMPIPAFDASEKHFLNIGMRVGGEYRVGNMMEMFMQRAFENKKLWMFRLMCKSVADGFFIIDGKEQVIDTKMLNGLKFEYPTEQEIQLIKETSLHK